MEKCTQSPYGLSQNVLETLVGASVGALLKALVTNKPLLPEIELAWALRAAKFCIGPNDRRKA